METLTNLKVKIRIMNNQLSVEGCTWLQWGMLVGFEMRVLKIKHLL